MTAIEWTLVGLMAASLGVLATAVFSRLARIDARIETLGAGISSRIDALLTETLDVPHDQHGSTSSDRKPSG